MITPITDHEGNSFRSITAMCKHWGISRSTYDYRLAHGWSVEKTLTTPINTKAFKSVPCQDHLGNHYADVTAMCEHWGVSQKTYTYRRENGQTVEQALTSSTNRGEHTDHTGQTFRSQAAMCKAWGISPQAYLTRINNGWSLEEALTTPVASRSSHVSQRTCTDHEGTEYPSHAAMCAAWGINYNTYMERLARGMTQEEALTTGKHERAGKPCQDHLGQTFPSTAAMCRHWEIGLSTFQGRITRGLTLEEALTTPVKETPPSHQWHLNI